MVIPRLVIEAAIVAAFIAEHLRQFALPGLMNIMRQRTDQTSISPLRMAISVNSAEFPAPSFCFML
jgi:hypothetical protein